MDPLLAQDIADSRRLSLRDKLMTALELMSLGIEMKREQLRRDHPTLTESQLEQKYIAWVLEDTELPSA